jgi:hypothetical protein
MKPQKVVVALAIVAGGVGLTAMVERPVAPVQQAAAIQQVAVVQEAAPPEFDFTALHRQASDALDNLRRAQQRRAQTNAAAY